jgi:hypothetical protein
VMLVASLVGRLGIEALAQGLVRHPAQAAGCRQRRAQGDGADLRDGARWRQY